MSEKLERGNLFKVTKTMLAKKANPRGEFPRRLVVEIDEIIEFRYSCDAHFRTIEDLYLVVTEETFKDSTKPYGTILDNIKSRNQNTLKEVLEAKLYDPTKETQ